MNVDDVQPVIQVFAKQTFTHVAVQIPIRGHDDADVDGQRLDRSDPANLALLDDPQQLCLNLDINLGDLVEQEGSAVGLLEYPRAAAFAGACEGSVHVAEQHAVHQADGQSGKIEGDERPAPARGYIGVGLGK